MASSRTVPEEVSKGRADGNYELNDVSLPDTSEGIRPSSGARNSEQTFETRGSLLVDRLMAYIPLPRRLAAVAIGAVLLGIPAFLAYRDGLLSVQVLLPYRSQFIYPFVIVYILLVFDFLEGTRAGVALGLRPLVETDDDAYASLVERGCRVPPAGELTAIGVGLVLSLAITSSIAPPPADALALERYAYYASKVMLSLDIWFIYVVFAMTRLTNTLLRQPMHVDNFDLAPFEPIGHQTVWLCLTFVGYLMFGLSGFDNVYSGLYWASLIFFAMIVVFVLAVFYVNTFRVHGVLSANKRRRLAAVNARLVRASSELEETSSDNPKLYGVAAHINALAVVKQELKQSRTWPYNTEMLRTLVISVVTPAVVGLSRIAAVLLASGSAGR